MTFWEFCDRNIAVACIGGVLVFILVMEGFAHLFNAHRNRVIEQMHNKPKV